MNTERLSPQAFWEGAIIWEGEKWMLATVTFNKHGDGEHQLVWIGNDNQCTPPPVRSIVRVHRQLKNPTFAELCDEGESTESNARRSRMNQRTTTARWGDAKKMQKNVGVQKNACAILCHPFPCSTRVLAEHAAGIPSAEWGSGADHTRTSMKNELRSDPSAP